MVLWNMCMSKISFSSITPKILTFEYYTKNRKLFRIEFYMCVPNLVKIDWEVAAKNPRDGRHEILFFDISTSDRGDFPRIIENALFVFLSLFVKIVECHVNVTHLSIYSITLYLYCPFLFPKDILSNQAIHKEILNMDS